MIIGYPQYAKLGQNTKNIHKKFTNWKFMNTIKHFFPPYCISCQKLTYNNRSFCPSHQKVSAEAFYSSRQKLPAGGFYSYVCRECLSKIEIIDDYRCVSCHEFTPFGKTCKSCFKNSPINGLIIATDYQNPILKDLIHFMKYRYVKDLSLPLSWLLFKKLEKFDWKNIDDWIILSVPLSKKRFRSRGFNQSELISQNISKWLNIPTSSAIIKRTRFVTPQMQIKNHSQRIANVKNSFKMVEGIDDSMLEKKLKTKKILLVDDVITTGATLIECSKTIKPYVKEVWGCVVAE
jgi:competence protein ComFC